MRYGFLETIYKQSFRRDNRKVIPICCLQEIPVLSRAQPAVR